LAGLLPLLVNSSEYQKFFGTMNCPDGRVPPKVSGADEASGKEKAVLITAQRQIIGLSQV
jgi:hypothetical protein